MHNPIPRRSFLQRASSKLLIGLKIAVIAVCSVITFGGHYPPATAQTRRDQLVVPVITVKDAQQDDHIEEINKHLETTDARVQKQWDMSNKNASDISGMQGEERGIGALLGLLSAVQIFIQVRSKKEA